MRGNVIDLAIAVSLAPLIGILLGGVDFATLSFQVGDAVGYGKFLQATVNFLIIAFVLFLIIRSINRFQKKPVPAPAAPTSKECPQCFTSIPIKATRCPNCTSQL